MYWKQQGEREAQLQQQMEAVRLQKEAEALREAEELKKAEELAAIAAQQAEEALRLEELKIQLQKEQEKAERLRQEEESRRAEELARIAAQQAEEARRLEELRIQLQKEQEEAERLRLEALKAAEEAQLREAAAEAERRRLELVEAELARKMELQRQEELQKEAAAEAQRQQQEETERANQLFFLRGLDEPASTLLEFSEDGQQDLMSDEEEALQESSFAEEDEDDLNDLTDLDGGTVVIEPDTLAIDMQEHRDGLLTRSGSSMFNILDRTSNLNGTIHTTSVFPFDRTTTFYTKKAEGVLKDAFNCPLSDSDEDSSEDSQDTHLHGFTGHIEIDSEEDPLAALNGQSDSGFTICRDATGPFSIAEDDGDLLLLPESPPRSAFPVFADENHSPSPFLREIAVPLSLEEPFQVLSETPLETEAIQDLGKDFSGKCVIEQNSVFEFYQEPSGQEESLFSGPLEDSDYESDSDDSEKDKENKLPFEKAIQTTPASRIRPSSSWSAAVSPFMVHNSEGEDSAATEDILELSFDESRASQAPFSVFNDSPVVATKSEPRRDQFGSFCVFQDEIGSEVESSGSEGVDVFQLDDIESATDDIFDMSDLDSSFDHHDSEGTFVLDESEQDLTMTAPISFSTVQLKSILTLSTPIKDRKSVV